MVAGGGPAGPPVYFLGTDDDGRVALYRGLPYELPLGIDLYSEQDVDRRPGGDLSPERQEVVTEHKLRSEDDARDIIDDIEPDARAPQPLTPATPRRRRRLRSNSNRRSSNRRRRQQGAQTA